MNNGSGRIGEMKNKRLCMAALAAIGCFRDFCQGNGLQRILDSRPLA